MVSLLQREKANGAVRTIASRTVEDAGPYEAGANIVQKAPSGRELSSKARLREPSCTIS